MPAITVPGVPSNTRVPFTYFGLDNSQAGFFQSDTRILVFGQKLPAGSATDGQIVQVFGNQAGLFGQGSMLSSMIDTITLNAANAEVWAIPLADVGVAGEWTVTVTSTITTAQVVNLLINGQVFQVTAFTTDTDDDIATNLAAAINADVSVPVTAVAAANVITLTAKSLGEIAGDVDIRNEYRRLRVSNSEVLLTVAQTVAPAGAPDVTAAVNGLADEAFDWIANPYTDTVSINALSSELSDLSGRWGALQALYGHAGAAIKDTPANLSAFGNTLNDQHLSLLGFAGSPTPAYNITAALVAKFWLHLSTAPELSRPMQTIELSGVLAPEAEEVFNKQVRQTLYFDGIGSVTVDRDGTVRIDRVLTTYKTNDAGAPDSSYLDVQTLAQLQYLIRYFDARIKQLYPRHALRGDLEISPPGSFTVTPRDVRNTLIAAAQELSNQNVIEDVQGFVERVIVQRASDNGGDPNCLEMIIQPDLVNQFRIAKILVQFFNQYPQN